MFSNQYGDDDQLTVTVWASVVEYIYNVNTQTTSSTGSNTGTTGSTTGTMTGTTGTTGTVTSTTGTMTGTTGSTTATMTDTGTTGTGTGTTGTGTTGTMTGTTGTVTGTTGDTAGTTSSSTMIHVSSRSSYGVTVDNVDPTLNVTNPAGSSVTINLGDSLSLSGSVNDQGYSDTLTLKAAWGEQSGTSSTVGSTLSPVSNFSAAFNYSSPGNYTVTLTLSDDDGGSTTETRGVNVLTDPPPVVSVIEWPSGDEGYGTWPSTAGPTRTVGYLLRVGRVTLGLEFYSDELFRTKLSTGYGEHL